MNTAAVERIAKAVLYEGYMLYPYRPSAVKNQQRFNFGVVYPQSYSEVNKGSDSWIMQTECLVQGQAQTSVAVRVRFLQLTARSVEERVARGLDVKGANGTDFVPVRSLEVDGRRFYAWEEAVEREVAVPSTMLGELVWHPQQCAISLPYIQAYETLVAHNGAVAGRFIRTQQAIDGAVSVAAHPAGEGVYRLVVRVTNATPFGGPHCARREDALMRSLISAHVVLGAAGGEFVSLLDPPEALRDLVALCSNVRVFPVLVGEAGQRDTMLASPIILYDYPQIAPESAGDLFDGTEIDEILSLRILTMTDEEKLEMRQADDRTRQLLENIESLPAEHLMKLHGVLRALRPLPEDSR
jgi:hydrogenase maturation protease